MIGKKPPRNTTEEEDDSRVRAGRCRKCKDRPVLQTMIEKAAEI